MELDCITFSEANNLAYNQKIQEFAIACKSNEYYQVERNANSDMHRVLANIALSKKTEIACYFYLRKHFPNSIIGKVDFEIRGHLEKGWMPDLTMDNADVHVKSCDEQTHKYVGDYSWTFQKNNNSGIGGRDVLYDNSHQNDLCMFTYMKNWRDPHVHIKFLSTFKLIMPLLKSPKSPKLSGLKECLYFKDINKMALAGLYTQAAQ